MASESFFTFARSIGKKLLDPALCPAYVDENIISVSALHTQFKTILTLLPKNGYLRYRKLNRKLATIEQVNGLYKLRGQVVTNIESALNTGDETETPDQKFQKVSNTLYVISDGRPIIPIIRIDQWDQNLINVISDVDDPTFNAKHRRLIVEKKFKEPLLAGNLRD